MAPKKIARQAALERRRIAFEALQGEAHQAAMNLHRLLSDHPRGTIVSAYVPIRTEMPTLEMMADLHDMGFRICVPIIDGPGKPLDFRIWEPQAEMEHASFGVPIPKNGEHVTPQVLLVPMVAFDRRGARMGYGGGYYDRTIHKLRAGGTVLAIGLAFSGQEVDLLPTDDHDQFMDAIVTETGILDFRDQG